MAINTEHAMLLRNGAVGIIPTDTVYGIVAQACNPVSVKRLYLLKAREKKPGTIIAANTKQLMDMGLEPKYIRMAIQFWPGPVSVVIPVDNKLTYLHQGVGSLAIRVVADPDLVKLLEITGPLVTSSANDPGQPIANNIKEAKGYFGDKVDFYIDGGDLSGRQASTIIWISEAGIEVLREGSIKIKSDDVNRNP